MRIFFLLIAFLIFNFSYAQPNWLFLKEKKPKYVGPQWIQKNKASIDIAEGVFVNWNAGGTNSISGRVDLKSSLNSSEEGLSKVKSVASSTEIKFSTNASCSMSSGCTASPSGLILEIK